MIVQHVAGRAIVDLAETGNAGFDLIGVDDGEEGADVAEDVGGLHDELIALGRGLGDEAVGHELVILLVGKSGQVAVGTGQGGAVVDQTDGRIQTNHVIRTEDDFTVKTEIQELLLQEPMDLFSEFYERQNDRKLTGEQKEYLTELIGTIFQEDANETA